ncbi:MAG: FG-GAP and VCBS repeat-containing protein [Verrucomicrobiales bacterium]
MIARSILVVSLPVAAWGLDTPMPVFEPQVIDPAIKIGYGLAIADIDGDRRPDVILADKTEIVWYENPTWKKHVMARQLTLMDNVCVAARDIDGDGRAEVAVGAQWNPGETVDEAKSGAVFYLQRPEDPRQLWTPVKLTHEPTVHRMKWVQTGSKEFQLVVVPLHGRGNNPGSGEGDPVRVLAHAVPENRAEASAWTTQVVDTSLNKTHNFEVRRSRQGTESVWIGGRQGVRQVSFIDGRWQGKSLELPGLDKGVGEIRVAGTQILSVIQPMHGNEVVIYHDDTGRTVLDAALNQGHALLCQPLLGGGFPEVVAGWREPDADGRTGIKLFVRDATASEETWATHVLGPDVPMACEDIAAADMDADGKPDLVAAGRASHNVVIYWNKSDFGPAATRDRPALPELSEEEKARAEERRHQRIENGGAPE